MTPLTKNSVPGGAGPNSGPSENTDRGNSTRSPIWTAANYPVVPVEYFTRSSDLPGRLDLDAVEQVEAMIAQGWESPAAAQAWLGWVELVAQAAADLAVAEMVWGGGAE